MPLLFIGILLQVEIYHHNNYKDCVQVLATYMYYIICIIIDYLLSCVEVFELVCKN